MRWLFLLATMCMNAGCRRAPPGIDPGKAAPVTCAGATVDLRTDAKNCGFCGHACTAAHGTTSCVDGVCKPTCDTGYMACVAADGCAHRVADDARACGACGVVCDLARCIKGVCGPVASLVSKAFEDGFYGNSFALDGTLHFTKTAARVVLATGTLETNGELMPAGYEDHDLFGAKGSGEACVVVRRDAKGNDAVIAKWPGCAPPFVVVGGRAFFARHVESKRTPPYEQFYDVIARDLVAGTETKLATRERSAERVWAHGERVYWTAQSPNTFELRSTSTSGGPIASLLSAPQLELISSDAQHLYVRAGNVLGRLPYAGGEPEWVAGITDLNGGVFTAAVAVDRDLYWITTSQARRSGVKLFRTAL